MTRRLMWVLVGALIGYALAQELMKPPSERAWHGRIGGVIPYDFRPPTLRRVAGSYWNPSERRVLVDRAFGIGWDVNIGALVARARSALGFAA